METMKIDIKERLNEVRGYIEANKKELGDIVFISLIGSQNYGCATNESDYDFKVFLIPNLNTIVTREKIDAENIKYNSNKIEQITIHDIRNAAHFFYKGNPNYLEALSTNYIYINPKYQEEVSTLRAGVFDFIYKNKRRFYQALNGTTVSNLRDFKTYEKPKNLRFILRSYYTFINTENSLVNPLEYSDEQIKEMRTLQSLSPMEIACTKDFYITVFEKYIEEMSEKIDSLPKDMNFEDSEYSETFKSAIICMLLKKFKEEL